MASDVVHDLGSHSVVEHLVEESAGLLVEGVWVGVGVPANWPSNRLSVDFVSSSTFLWSSHGGWLVVFGWAVATANVHNTVALVVGGTHPCSIGAVNWDLVVVGPKSVPVSIRIVDESSL